LKLNKSEKGKALMKLFSAKEISQKEKEEALGQLETEDRSDTMKKRRLSCEVMLETDENKLI
jgi:hypothetical protein